MSLSVAIKVPEGIVLATDSRLSLAADRSRSLESFANDHASKLWCLGPPNSSVAVSFYGVAQTGIRSVGSLLKEWAHAQGERKTVEVIAHELHARLMTAGLRESALCVAGFDATNPFGRIFELTLPGAVTELHAVGTKGVSLGGKRELADLVLQTLQPPLDWMPLGGAAALAQWLIELTTTAQGFTWGFQSVGGKAQIAVLERNKAARLV